ncbi:MAG: DJ-1/PfpI family protein [Bacteroidaceae bacterium]|nr:DJ-1/PfpI family protein [Bacteroidaceae bacterium]
MLHLFLAPGFEEIEALGTLDILRRCGIEVMTVSVAGKRLVHGAHDIPVMADAVFRRAIVEGSEGFILPGGMPGANNLTLHDGLRKALLKQHALGRLIAAICAAPMVIGNLGILKGRKATCYPGFEDTLRDAIVSDKTVECDGHIITGKGLGAVIDFAFTIAARFKDLDDLAALKSDMILQ